MRVLVVDDDAVFREELAELLRDDHHAVELAPSVPKALELLGHDEYDVVLTDLKMPRHGGLELLQEVRNRWPRTLVVVVTGYATVETALEAMKSGAFDYVRKPFRIEQVRETLALAAQEREFDSPREAFRDPAREARSLAASGRHEVLFLAEPVPESGPHLTGGPLDPDHPAELLARAEQFVGEHPDAAIVLAGVERIVERHRLEDVVGVLDRLRAMLDGHGPLRVGFNPRRVSPAAAVALGGAVTAGETHATLEALANPIRRRVLQRLAEAPATFGEAMEAAGLDDSPKMAFHLRKLVETGLVLHEAETYKLTTRGLASVRLLTDATFLPPAGDADNLAFAGRRAPGAPDRPGPGGTGR
ncbi:MAG TPA: response regulator [Thermoplasmata archaeon]|nr:response regulator [Thermoplasmata archaeon]